MLTSTARRRIAAGLLTTLALAGSALVTEPASAATTQDVVYSTDGGTTWTTTPTVAPGATVLVRQWFDNTDDLHATAASETTTLPARFTPTGTTQVCLNPSTTSITSPNGTELQCATADSGAVWSDTSLTISPTAGLFGQPASDTNGILAAGRKHYLDLAQCRWVAAGNPTRSAHALPYTFDFETDSGATNTPLAGPGCHANLPGWDAESSISSMQAFDLFGQRFLNLHQCRWEDGDDNVVAWHDGAADTRYASATNTSNAADAAESCTAGGAGFPVDPLESGFQSFDTLTNRYLNLHQCGFTDGGNGRIPTVTDANSGQFLTGSNASNTADTSATCSTTEPGWSLFEGTGVQAIDLLDAARGKGYVEYSMTAPAEPTAAFCDALDGDPVTAESFTQNTALTSSAGTAPATGTLSVDWTQLTDPCPDDIGNLIDPGTGLLTAGTLALAGAGVATYRRRRTTLA